MGKKEIWLSFCPFLVCCDWDSVLFLDWSVVIGIVFFSWIGMFTASEAEQGLWAFAFPAFMIQASIMTSLRTTVRKRLGITGDPISDRVASFALYPQVLFQLYVELRL